MKLNGPPLRGLTTEGEGLFGFDFTWTGETYLHLAPIRLVGSAEHCRFCLDSRVAEFFQSRLGQVDTHLCSISNGVFPAPDPNSQDT
jgi:hypothetical protein